VLGLHSRDMQQCPHPSVSAHEERVCSPPTATHTTQCMHNHPGHCSSSKVSTIPNLLIPNTKNHQSPNHNPQPPRRPNTSTLTAHRQQNEHGQQHYRCRCRQPDLPCEGSSAPPLLPHPHPQSPQASPPARSASSLQQRSSLASHTPGPHCSVRHFRQGSVAQRWETPP
jgi:hypothetical protein